jgi:type IV secretion system protein TrbL
MTLFDIGFLNDVLDAFEAATANWVFALYPIALRTFFTLASIELSWSMVRHLIATSANLAGLLELVFRKVLVLCFAYYLLYFSPAIIPLLLRSFQHAGGVASGIDALRPSEFLTVGLQIAGFYMAQANSLGILLDPFAANLILLATFISVALFGLMSAIILLTLIEAFLVIPCAVFLLPFAATRWTASIAEGVLVHTITLGLRLFLLYLVAGILRGFLDNWSHQIQLEHLISPLSYVGLNAQLLCLTLVLWSTPRLANRLIRPTLALHLTPAIGDN